MRRKIIELVRSRDGSFAVMSALLIVPLLAAASLALDTAAAYLEATKLQESLDAAALGSLKAFAETQSVPIAVKTAKGLFGGSFKEQFASPLLESDGTFKVDLDLSSAAFEEVAEASATIQYKPNLLPWAGFDITRRSLAIRSKPMESCILALHPSNARSFTVSGSSNVDLTECTVVANSASEQAIYIAGNAQFKAKCLISHGGISLHNSVNLACDTPATRAPIVADPYAHKQLPEAGDYPARLVPQAAKVALLPGRYREMKLGVAAALAPGYYFIDGGKLQITDSAIVIGEGVTFFLINGAELDIHGEAVINLSPSTKGTWAGFLIVAEHDNTQRAVINGNSNSSMTGIIYMPGAKELHYSGGRDTKGGCIRLVAQEITLIGSSRFSIDCSNQLAGNVVQTEGSIRLAR